ncbi:putative toxin-antitoxin system, toxin component [Streptomyces himastatinicus ATCC 53653]|uniref:Putative toxin-antitoxin system, toxin component n=1 Tax=Streptomyces himastatinicus ATCC 53653 TaxID=457427 RepID=D9WES3_9ACTN|nr:DUF397 domain-containing protein [Streptomyces himastatinicus]EFL25288.1 putative toxin-antitoxin system, toxin component [Streptomyces himastatinicus ATCC 53653]
MSNELAWFKSSYSNSEGGNCVEVALSWRKSSYSDTGGGNCVEVAAPWAKSSYSNSEGGECVEVATCPHTVHVRDSKQLGAGPQLALAPDAWAEFISFAAATAVSPA